MNKKNLLRMADHIEKVPQERFNPEIYRGRSDDFTPECNSVGCTIGHCAILDKWENVPRNDFGNIQFFTWSRQFTGVMSLSEWKYLFDPNWHKTDNTPTGAAKRIRYFVENGLPEDWEEQINGTAPLSYI